ncbi:MAG TPA: HlyD family secretion protein [Terracidiphilus sp.]
MADYIPTPEPIEQEAEMESAQPQSRRRGIVVAVVVILALVAIGIWWRSTYSESTDDAQVNGHLIQVSSRIAGQVAKVYVDENQVVKAGDLIAELDPSDYKVAVENAEAALASAQANAAAANVNVPITTVNTGSNLSAADANVTGSHAAVVQAEEQLEAAQANNIKAQADLERYKPLVAKDVISKQQFDAAVAAADAARHLEEAASEGVRVARERESQAKSQLKFAQTAPEQVAAQSARARQAQAMVQQAQAQLDMARLNLSYTKIVAPAAGIITRKSVEINQNVAPGQNLMMLVSLEGLWVTANFKETQLRHMFAGQPVEIEVDSTGKTYHGKVTQIGGATGSVLSLFPPENATGNYVKVVQRVPVRIDFTNLAGEDPNHELRPGLSVEPKVKVK